jgi:hypothetical protein
MGLPAILGERRLPSFYMSGSSLVSVFHIGPFARGDAMRLEQPVP